MLTLIRRNVAVAQSIEFASREKAMGSFVFINNDPTAILLSLGRLFGFIMKHKVDITLGEELRSSQSFCLHSRYHKEHKGTETTIPRVRFKPMTPVFERTKTVHALLKICGFHDSDYEECCRHTSQITHYVSATEPSRLMLCKI
jgi:hypothetical protein